MNLFKQRWRSWFRIPLALGLLALAGVLIYWIWQPGRDIRDGRHDRRRNGIWMAHGWLGADEWFIRQHKTNQSDPYRNPTNLPSAAAFLRNQHITDLFPLGDGFKGMAGLARLLFGS